MLGKFGVLAIVASLAFAAGCTMCCHPYDNCGPVFDESSGHPYCSNVRAGSILEDRTSAAEPADSTEGVEESSESVSSTIPQRPIADGEPRILSTTDRQAGEMAAVSKTQTARHSTKQAANRSRSTTQQW